MFLILKENLFWPIFFLGGGEGEQVRLWICTHVGGGHSGMALYICVSKFCHIHPKHASVHLSNCTLNIFLQALGDEKIGPYTSVGQNFSHYHFFFLSFKGLLWGK